MTSVRLLHYSNERQRVHVHSEQTTYTHRHVVDYCLLSDSLTTPQLYVYLNVLWHDGGTPIVS